MHMAIEPSVQFWLLVEMPMFSCKRFEAGSAQQQKPPASRETASPLSPRDPSPGAVHASAARMSHTSAE